MTKMIQNKSLTFTDIKKDIEDYLKTLSNWNEISDNLIPSNLNILTDIVAGVTEYLLYNNHQLRNETYLSSANLESSVYNIAKTFGYQIARLTAPTLTVRYHGVPTRILQSGDIIGTYDNKYDLVYFGEDKAIEKLDSFQVHIGKYFSVDTKANYNNGILNFNLSPTTLKAIDNNKIALYYQGERFEFSKDPEEYVVYHQIIDFSVNPYSTMLMLADANYGYGKSIIASNDDIRIEWLETDGAIEDFDYTKLKIDCKDLEGNYVKAGIIQTEGQIERSDTAKVDLESNTYTFIESVHSGTDGDSLEHIRELTPFYYSTQRRMVTDTDHIYIMKAHPYIKDAYAERDDGVNQRSRINVSGTITSGTLIDLDINGLNYKWNLEAETPEKAVEEIAYHLRHDPIISVESYNSKELYIITKDPRYQDEWVFRTPELSREIIQVGVVPKCCTVNIYYLKYDTVDDPIELTYWEKKELMEYLHHYKMIGTRLVLFPSQKISSFINLDIKLNDNSYQTEIKTEILNIISKYELKLNTTFIYKNLLSSISQIKVADINTGELITPIISVYPSESTWDRYKELNPEATFTEYDISLLDIVRDPTRYIKFTSIEINFI